MGIIGVKYTIFYAKCRVIKIYKYGYCPGHMYIGYGMWVQYQTIIFHVFTLIPIVLILYVM